MCFVAHLMRTEFKKKKKEKQHLVIKLKPVMGVHCNGLYLIANLVFRVIP